MNSLKTMLMVAILVVIAYAAYVSINSSPVQVPREVAEGWPEGPPQISLPDGGDPGGAPNFAMGGPYDFRPSEAAPLPGRSSELSPPPSFSERAPAPPFNPAPMPPEISSNLDPVRSSASPVTPPSPVYGATPPIETGDNRFAGGSPYSADPPLPNYDAQMPPMPSGSPAFGAEGSERKQQPKSTEIRPEFAQLLAKARSDLDQGRFREALGSLSSRYGDPDQTAAEVAALTELLDQVAGTVIYSTQHLLEPAYVVRAGETLAQIAEKHEVSPELLAKINGIADPRNLQPGCELKVLRGPFRAVVKLEEHEMVLWLQDLYAGRFPIGVGTDKPDLEGSFAVLEKNREGTRRIGLGDGAAIHGTHDEGTIGQTGGPGIVRLGRRDSEDVFDILSLGSRVVIRR